jgi:hypothetical protein
MINIDERYLHCKVLATGSKIHSLKQLPHMGGCSQTRKWSRTKFMHSHFRQIITKAVRAIQCGWNESWNKIGTTLFLVVKVAGSPATANALMKDNASDGLELGTSLHYFTTVSLKATSTYNYDCFDKEYERLKWRKKQWISRLLSCLSIAVYRTLLLSKLILFI